MYHCLVARVLEECVVSLKIEALCISETLVTIYKNACISTRNCTIHSITVAKTSNLKLNLSFCAVQYSYYQLDRK
jgi:hypothetical protein